METAALEVYFEDVILYELMDPRFGVNNGCIKTGGRSPINPGKLYRCCVSKICFAQFLLPCTDPSDLIYLLSKRIANMPGIGCKSSLGLRCHLNGNAIGYSYMFKPNQFLQRRVST